MSIAVLGRCTSEGQKFMHQLGVKSGQLLLETKYYSCSVPVEFGNVTDSTKAVVVLEDLSLLDKIELDDDCVKLVFSECGETKVHACIDRGFELVLQAHRVSFGKQPVKKGGCTKC